MDLENEIFVVHITSSAIFDKINLFCRAQIVSWKVDQTLTITSLQYFNFADIFCLELAAELPKHIEINSHAIDLIYSEQPSYKSIYGLEAVSLRF